MDKTECTQLDNSKLTVIDLNNMRVIVNGKQYKLVEPDRSEPKFKKNDVVYDERGRRHKVDYSRHDPDCLVYRIENSVGVRYVAEKDIQSEAEHYTRIVNGVAVRCYIDEYGCSLYYCRDKDGDCECFAQESIKVLGIDFSDVPAMPYSEHRGNMPYPEKPEVTDE